MILKFFFLKFIIGEVLKLIYIGSSRNSSIQYVLKLFQSEKKLILQNIRSLYYDCLERVHKY